MDVTVAEHPWSRRQPAAKQRGQEVSGFAHRFGH